MVFMLGNLAPLRFGVAFWHSLLVTIATITALTVVLESLLPDRPEPEAVRSRRFARFLAVGMGLSFGSIAIYEGAGWWLATLAVVVTVAAASRASSLLRPMAENR